MNQVSAIARNATLQAMIEAVTAAERGADAGKECRIAAAIAPFLDRAELLAGIDCPGSPERYVRHLLHEDRERGWAMVAIVWESGQASPVHGHRTWCALGVHRGWLEERFFALGIGGRPVRTRTLSRSRGATSSGPADITLIHQLANVSDAPAVSIHVYGVRYDRFGEGVNWVYEPA
ncbi:cysteine dioxygenase family protein [Elioraea sp.]|uniref:cysteine dioxygenase family protein n=1 Tax=Elioraea sp. TaxID=2185103 RepID=UPI00307F6912